MTTTNEVRGVLEAREYVTRIGRRTHDQGAYVELPVGTWTWIYKNAATFTTPEEALRAATLATR